MKKLLTLILSLLLACSLASAAAAADDTKAAKDVLSAKIGEFIAILKDPAYAGGNNKDEQAEKIKAVLDTAFNFRSVSVGAVGRMWRKFSEEEKTEFTKYFSELLVRTYLGRIQENYRNEEVSIDYEDEIKPGLVAVNTRVLREAGNVPVIYVMSNRDQDKQWRIIDIKVEGVSLIANYRSQYTALLTNNPPSAAIEKVKEQLAQLDKEQ